MLVDRIKVDKTLQNRLFEKCLFANGVGKYNFSASISSVRPSQHCLSPRWLGSVVYLPEAPMLPAMSHHELRNQQFIGFNRPSLTAGVPYWKQTLTLRTAHQEFSDWSIREHALRGVYAIINSLRTWYTRIWLFDYISCIIMVFKQRVRIEWANFRTDAQCVYQHKQPVLMQSNDWIRQPKRYHQIANLILKVCVVSRPYVCHLV